MRFRAAILSLLACAFLCNGSLPALAAGSAAAVAPGRPPEPADLPEAAARALANLIASHAAANGVLHTSRIPSIAQAFSSPLGWRSHDAPRQRLIAHQGPPLPPPGWFPPMNCALGRLAGAAWPSALAELVMARLLVRMALSHGSPDVLLVPVRAPEIRHLKTARAPWLLRWPRVLLAAIGPPG